MVLSRTGFNMTLLAVVILIFYMVLLAAPSNTLAQDVFNCDDFDTQQEAQDELNANPSDPNGLDGDSDGVACESLPGGGTDTGGTSNNLNCSAFVFQEEAQAELARDPSDPNNLDADNDGVPCENLPIRDGTTGERTVQERSTPETSAPVSGRDRQRRNVMPGSVPRRPLPPTGGVPVSLIVAGFVLAGTSLLGASLVVRRGRRR